MYVSKMFTILKLIRNFFKTKTIFLTFMATIYEVLGHKWKKGTLTCPHGKYTLHLQQYVHGKLVGEIKVKTCIKCDPGS